jgi:proteasome lid subunit RPN8/RPN11
MKISNEQKEEIIKYAREAEKNEVCGILSGRNGRVEKIHQMKNVSQTPETCFFMDPGEQLKVMKEIRKNDLQLIGIYHSHPSSGAYPSGRDVELAFYPDAVHLILSLQQGVPEFAAFKIVEGKIIEEGLE